MSTHSSTKRGGFEQVYEASELWFAGRVGSLGLRDTGIPGGLCVYICAYTYMICILSVYIYIYIYIYPGMHSFRKMPEIQ